MPTVTLVLPLVTFDQSVFLSPYPYYNFKNAFWPVFRKLFCRTKKERSALQTVHKKAAHKLLVPVAFGSAICYTNGVYTTAERPANESQVGISRFQVRKKATRNQTAERSKIETAVGQRGVQYEIRSAPVCLDKQLPRRSRYAGTCWQKPSCRPCKAFLRNAFCP